ncbi:hypothetical protein [Spartinivicinus poritis]|uniref:Uncharacterized protein n=1 Tax=Spartinivicinus poritis TaxID=2994640 RepID=A0ABT5U4U3_9GAMM|nr:hypothetical protein [Spartinivicinus sp. A2-2]MDE1461378.1 hypothetical protein [Spartinivicinus sp. A2-2]
MKKAIFFLLFTGLSIVGCSQNTINNESLFISEVVTEEAASTCTEWAFEDKVPSDAVNKYVNECVAYLIGERDEPAYL